ncbi:LpxI family protein [Microbaculum marinum]|uniref:UDP-2,3-diacylglucosamine diphosphatase LpxI n=1 Tax=Microbaculum marinum TaxID=1764581 RepID=A0AAW9S2A9_9HYPH
MPADAADRSDPATGSTTGTGPLAILAGAGELPKVIADEVARTGRPIFAVEVDGETDCDLSAYPRTRLPIGAAGRLKTVLMEHGCRDVLMAGSFRRPRFSEIEWNMGTVRALSSIMRLKVGGDDAVVNGVVHIFESEGFRIVGPREVVPRLVAPQGTIGRLRPGKKARSDIALGLSAIGRMGPLDIGQAVIVLAGRIVAVEAAEGTDSMIARCAQLRDNGRIAAPPPSGVLVKAMKPGQELRLDMPVVGLDTVRGAAAAGLEGIAIEAGKVLLPRIEEVGAAADDAGLFIVGVDLGDRTGRPE